MATVLDSQTEQLQDDMVQRSSFLRAAEFEENLARFVKLDLQLVPTNGETVEELAYLTTMCNIVRMTCDYLETLCADLSALQLDEYQEQSYLLDPHLDRLINPLLQTFRRHVRKAGASLNTARVGRLAELLYFFTKVRGAKTVGMHRLHTREDHD